MFLRKMELETKLQLLKVIELVKPLSDAEGCCGFIANGGRWVSVGLGVPAGGTYPCVPCHQHPQPWSL